MEFDRNRLKEGSWVPICCFTTVPCSELSTKEFFIMQNIQLASHPFYLLDLAPSGFLFPRLESTQE
jgi:hypothetical protein